MNAEAFKAAAMRRWPMLTNDDLAVAGMDRDKLVGRVQDRYCMVKDQARQEVDEWLAAAHP